MTVYTAEALMRLYQLGFAHGANGQPPLDGPQVLRVAELGRVDTDAKDNKQGSETT